MESNNMVAPLPRASVLYSRNWSLPPCAISPFPVSISVVKALYSLVQVASKRVREEVLLSQLSAQCQFVLVCITSLSSVTYQCSHLESAHSSYATLDRIPSCLGSYILFSLVERYISHSQLAHRRFPSRNTRLHSTSLRKEESCVFFLKLKKKEKFFSFFP